MEAYVIGFGHCGNLLQLQDSAGLNNVGLNHFHDVPWEQVCVVPLGVEPFPGGKWNVHGLSHSLQCVQALWRDRFLIDVGTVFLHGIPYADGICRRQVSMDLHQQLHIVPHGLTNGL